MNKIIIVSTKNWNLVNIRKFKKKKNKIKIRIISDNKKLNQRYLNKFSPDFIFFIHWSRKVKNEIIKKYNCYNFHMTDLPFGRGGSPLQNLLLRDIEKTKISLFKMNNKLDAGSILYKENFFLKGSAQQIYESLSKKCIRIIDKILKKNKIKYIKQEGRVRYFKRIKNNKLIIKKNQSLRNIYNQIRMRDANTYLKTFIKVGNYKISLKNAKIKSKSINGEFEIK